MEGLSECKGQEFRIEFQNENLVVFPLKDGSLDSCIASVPDLICVVDADTAGNSLHIDVHEFEIHVCVS